MKQIKDKIFVDTNILIYAYSSEVLGKAVYELSQLCLVSLIDIDTIKSALNISEKFRYSYYDSLIISAALMNNCTALYSEDMQHQHIIENKLVIINPFK